MDFRAKNRRDRIILTYACGDVEFDSGLRRYGFYARTDNDTFERISQLCRRENVTFTNSDFNRFIGEVNGLATTNRRLWPHVLPAGDILPGERLLINSGYDGSEIELMKLSSVDYLIVRGSTGNDSLPEIVTIGRDQKFATGTQVEICGIGPVTVYTVEFLMPTDMNRAVDALKMRNFARKTVATDLRGFYKEVVVALREGRFESEFDTILASACEHGASSWVIRTIVDAYTLKRL